MTKVLIKGEARKLSDDELAERFFDDASSRAVTKAEILERMKLRRMAAFVRWVRAPRFNESERVIPFPKGRGDLSLMVIDLSSEEFGLLQAIRTVFKPLHSRGLVPESADWHPPYSKQRIAPEAAVYLSTWEIWTKDWKPPKNLSLPIVKAILTDWVAADAQGQQHANNS